MQPPISISCASALAGDSCAAERLAGVCEGMAARFVAARGTAPEESRLEIRRAVGAILARLPHYRGETPLFVFAFSAMTWGLAARAQRGSERQEAASRDGAHAAEQG